MEIVLLIIRLVLFGVFAIAGIGKLLDLEGSEKAVKAFGTPDALANPFAILIPIAELIFAFCFLFIGMSWVGAIGGLILLASFIGGMLWQMKLGNAPDCHCFGQIHSEPVGPKSLIRNFIIAGLAAVLFFSGANQGFALGETNAQIAQNVAIAVLAVGLIVVGSYLFRLVSENRHLKRRVELLEMFESGGQPVERSEMGDPNDSLPIGAPFPDFSLPDINGRTTTFEHVLPDRLPKLFVFIGPNCDPCKSLMPDFIAWRKEFEGRIRFVFVSTGSADANKERFSEELLDGMLLQKGMEFAHKLYIKWTPAALFVSADGTIAGHPAIGDTAIKDMIGRLRRENFSEERYYISNGKKRGRVKIGEKIPEFSLKDLDGNLVTKDYFSDKPTLTFFLSTTCGYCGEVIDQIKKWEISAERNGTNAIVFSDGDPELHRAYGLETPIVLDTGYSVSNNLGMFGVPSGLLIDQDGIIATETAEGGPMIWSLIGKEV